MAPGLFAQGQLIGVQSQQQEAMKTEIKAWDDVASRHPYSVYRKNDYAAYVNKHKNDVFTTSFGTGLPYRVQDRNHRAQTMTEATLKMEQPYPLGYTGHVSETRQVIGQTYGRASILWSPATQRPPMCLGQKPSSHEQSVGGSTSARPSSRATMKPHGR